MTRDHPDVRRVTADALHPGTTVRYHHRNGTSLATVVRHSDRYVSFLGAECNGTFTDDQIETLFDDGRLQVVLDDESHVPEDGELEGLPWDSSSD